MELSKSMRTALVDEIKSVVRKMKETSDPLEKIYFFSAISGQVVRIINFKYDKELSFVNFVLGGAYAQISNRLVAMSKQQEKPASIPNGFFDKLQQELESLAQKIENDESTYKELENISHLTYSTTGNGYYLYVMGRLNI